MAKQGSMQLISKAHVQTWMFGGILIICLLVSVLMLNPVPLLLPVGIIGLAFISIYFEKFYYLFWFLLPFSIEFELPGGFGTDLPSEPLMLVLSYCGLLLLGFRMNTLNKKLFTHPISLLLVLHLGWIAFASFFSTNVLFSVKYLLAKTWYVLPFFFLPIALNKKIEYHKLFKYFLVGLFVSIVYVMLRHAQLGFGFDAINKAVRPIYRNHVNYGIMLIACLPYYVYLCSQSVIKSKGMHLAGLLVLLAAIYLTYTRAAHISVVLAIAVYFVVKLKMARYAVLAGIIAVLALSVYLVSGNRYLEMAPEYTKAIEHKKFDNLVEATYKMEDISTVERFYRWIAGVNMISAKPITGFGPACFYSEYKSYTVTSYKTYVSDNPERSGIHNYYLMTAVEQGIPGLLIFLALAIIPILYAEKYYHKLKSASDKALIMAAIVCHVCILAVLLINDLLEADKVGPVFFLGLAIIVSLSTKIEKNKHEKQGF